MVELPDHPSDYPLGMDVELVVTTTIANGGRVEWLSPNPNVNFVSSTTLVSNGRATNIVTVDPIANEQTRQVTLEARDAMNTTDSSSKTYDFSRFAIAVLEDKPYARNPARGQPIVWTDPSMYVEITVMVVRATDPSAVQARHVVGIELDPPNAGVRVYDVATNQQINPSNGRWQVTTDIDGKATIRVASLDPIACSATFIGEDGTANPSSFVIATLRAGTLAPVVLEWDPDQPSHIQIPPNPLPYTPCRIPRGTITQPDNKTCAVIINDKYVPFSQSANSAIQGFHVPYSMFQANNQAWNTMGYFIQDAVGSTTWSSVARFKVDGEVLVRPDPNANRIMSAQTTPYLDGHATVVNSNSLTREVNVNIPFNFDGDDWVEIGYKITLLVYLNGYEHQTNVRKQGILVPPKTVTLTAQDMTNGFVVISVERSWLVGWGTNADGTDFGTFDADYFVTSTDPNAVDKYPKHWLTATLSTVAPTAADEDSTG